ncbi:hypothetical protein Esti_001700 [Eimeria stiedai]
MPADAATRMAPGVALLRGVTQHDRSPGALSLQQKGDASVGVDTVVNDKILQGGSALYKSGRGRKTRLTDRVLAAILVPLLAAFGLVYLCMRFRSRVLVTGTQQRRLAEGNQGDEGSFEELQEVLLECIEATQRGDLFESPGDPEKVDWPVPGAGQASAHGQQDGIYSTRNFAFSLDLQQSPPLEASTSTVPEALVDKQLMPEDIWALTASDLRLGEQNFGNGPEKWADDEQSLEAVTTENELATWHKFSLRSAEKHKLPFDDSYDEEDRFLIGDDIWWGQEGNCGSAKRQRRDEKPAAPPTTTSETSLSEGSPIKRSPLEDHPLIRFPKVPPGAVDRMLRFDAVSLPKYMRNRAPLSLLKDMRGLLLKPVLDSVEAEQLMVTAEALIWRERLAASGGVGGREERPSHVLERLAGTFMVFDALMCTMYVLGQLEDLKEHWMKFTGMYKIHRVFLDQTDHGHYGRHDVQRNVRWSKRLESALEVYVRGYRPPPEEVFAIKKMILSSSSIRRFAGAAGKPWRDDLEGAFCDKSGGASGGSVGESFSKERVIFEWRDALAKESCARMSQPQARTRLLTVERDFLATAFFSGETHSHKVLKVDEALGDAGVGSGASNESESSEDLLFTVRNSQRLSVAALHIHT